MTRTHSALGAPNHQHEPPTAPEADNSKQQAPLPPNFRRPPCRMWRDRKLLVSLAGVGAVLLVMLLAVGQPAGVDGAKGLKALAKTFVYQQLTMRKNFVPLPVPIPVPIEINEPPVYLKGKPKYVNVYRPKPTAAPVVAKPTTVYHMPIYSPTYEYMSMDPMSSMYGHVAPVVYPGPYGKAMGAGHKLASNHHQQSLMEPADAYASSGSSSSSSSANFNDYDDETGAYYMGRAGRRRSKLLSAAAGDYISGASMDLHQRNDQDANHPDDLATSSSSAHRLSQQVAAAQLSSAVTSAPSVGTNQVVESPAAADEESDSGDEDEDQHDESPAASASPLNEESYDNEDESASRAVGLRRSKRQVYYQSGYDGSERCNGLPVEVNIRSRIKPDQVFPIYGRSQMRKCVKRKRPMHILPPPPPERHY